MAWQQCFQTTRMYSCHAAFAVSSKLDRNRRINNQIHLYLKKEKHTGELIFVNATGKVIQT